MIKPWPKAATFGDVDPCRRRNLDDQTISSEVVRWQLRYIPKPALTGLWPYFTASDLVPLWDNLCPTMSDAVTTRKIFKTTFKNPLMSMNKPRITCFQRLQPVAISEAHDSKLNLTTHTWSRDMWHGDESAPSHSHSNFPTAEHSQHCARCYFFYPYNVQTTYLVHGEVSRCI